MPSRARKSHIDGLISGDQWRKRRLVGGVVMVWLMGNVQFIILKGSDTVLNQQVVIAMIGAIVACFGSYVFGATWDDSSKRNFVANVEADPPPFNPADVENN
ncbi:hypothetical protein [Aestuariivirga litoralis]|uniref:hypothetical protein n=1 Tax=Aestuariivirga litoralis TaxID=2650924 RepID=UPI0018C72E99|nr:hypothetical protein [Aestuariivirga litoralis]MBG1232958.1 hypothetical protein [Aestuariivirga litoralis]